MKRLCMALLLCPSIAWGAPSEKKIQRVCGAKPDLSVATQTSQEKSAAVEGQARGIGGGSASGSAAGEATYEALAGRENSEKLMTQWTWCRMKVTGQMSDEVFQRRIDQLWGQDTQSIQVQTPAASENPQTTPPPKKSRTVKERERTAGGSFSPLPAEELAGSWSVTTVRAGNTCGKTPADGQDAFTWLVSRKADGQITVQVTGNTIYPKLAGTYTDGNLVVSGHSHGGVFAENQDNKYTKGYESHYFFSAKWHDFDVSSDGTLNGRILSQTTYGPHATGNVFWHGACTYFYTATGRKIQ